MIYHIISNPEDARQSGALPATLDDAAHLELGGRSLEQRAEEIALFLAVTPRSRVTRETLKAAAAALWILAARSRQPVRRRRRKDRA
jgi:hypothetical protein